MQFVLHSETHVSIWRTLTNAKMWYFCLIEPAKRVIVSFLMPTKCLTLNSKRYDKYLFNYKLFTQKKTFKVPNVMSYPIYKNKDIIQINMNGYTTMHSYSTSITEASNERKVRLGLKDSKDLTMFTGVGMKKDRRKYYSPSN